mmetsp:Transcript_13017/g.23142  ORF Transcript_13017/g.23142 Transcript_13017/m.23142 type:complete len:240 (+) Transcript_13017:4274-4993(+)
MSARVKGDDTSPPVWLVTVNTKLAGGADPELPTLSMLVVRVTCSPSTTDPPLTITNGGTPAASTPIVKVACDVTEVPSETIKVKPAVESEEPSCWKLTRPAWISASVKLLPGGTRPSTSREPPDNELTENTSASLAVSGSLALSCAVPIATELPTPTCAPLFATTTGGSSTGLTRMSKSCAGVVVVPSESVKRNPAVPPSEPSCWKLTRPASTSACVKVPAAAPGARPVTNTLPPTTLL